MVKLSYSIKKRGYNDEIIKKTLFNKIREDNGCLYVNNLSKWSNYKRNGCFK